MNRLEELRSALDRREARLAVVGLGYVGLSVATLMAEAGFEVTGVDVKADRVDLINAGRSPIEGREPGLAEALEKVTRAGRLRATTDCRELAAADVITISVETPVDEADHRPLYAALTAVCQSLGPVLQKGALVIVESTLSPGTMDRLVRPLLEAATGGRAGDDFYLGHCPERVMPGRLLANLRDLSRVVGGMSTEVAQTMSALYATFVRGELDQADMLTAELVKTTENAYRDVNIAFANQVALICEQVGGDVWKVRELVNKSPGRNMLLPGAGVGGHCIPKDPWLLAAGLPQGEHAPLIEAGRALNDGMPAAVARLARELMRDEGIQPDGARVAVLGYAYLEDSDDTRDSPTAHLLPHLERMGCTVAIHDPFVAAYRGAVMDTVADADCSVLMVRHSAYAQLDLAQVAARMRRPLFVDARALFNAEQLREAGFAFQVLGSSRRTRVGV